MKVPDEKSRIRIRKPVIRIRGKMSRIHNTGLNIRYLRCVCVYCGYLEGCHTSQDPDPEVSDTDPRIQIRTQNVTYPQHWTKYTWRAVTHLRAALSRPDTWCSHFVPSSAYTHYTLYIIHYTLYIVYCTLYIVHCIP
jgi:hypothetical protein